MLLASALLVCGLALLPKPAQACSGCYDVGAAPKYFEMPVDFVGLRRVPASFGDSLGPTLHDLDNDVDVPLLSTPRAAIGVVDFYPEQTLNVGGHYRFDYGPSLCVGSMLSFDFEATAPMNLAFDRQPSLGTLVVGDLESGIAPFAGGPECFEAVEVLGVDINVVLEPTLAKLEPWLLYATLVDGEPWTHVPEDFSPPQVGTSWVGRGRDRLLATCPDGAGGGLTPGPHQVQMIAHIAGLPAIEFASDVVVVDFDCAQLDNPTGDESDSDSNDDYVFPIDDVEGDGCSCRTGGEGPAPLLFSMLGLFGLGLTGLRARARRAACPRGRRSAPDPRG